MESGQSKWNLAIGQDVDFHQNIVRRYVSSPKSKLHGRLEAGRSATRSLYEKRLHPPPFAPLQLIAPGPQSPARIPARIAVGAADMANVEVGG